MNYTTCCAHKSALKLSKVHLIFGIFHLQLVLVLETNVVEMDFLLGADKGMCGCVRLCLYICLLLRLRVLDIYGSWLKMACFWCFKGKTGLINGFIPCISEKCYEGVFI